MVNNKLYYSIVGVMVIVAIVVWNRLLVLEEVPDKKVFAIHLNILDKTARRLREGCHEHYKKAKDDNFNGASPDVIRVLAALDHVESFGDSADFYFDRLESFKNDPDSARLCFEKYARFSNRFTMGIQEATGVETMKSYLLSIHERLPGNKLPFESEEGVKLLVLLLRIDFYETTQRAMNKLVTFTG